MNLEINVAQLQQAINYKGKLMKKMLKDNIMKSTGCLYGFGFWAANVGIKTKTKKMSIEIEKKEKTQQSWAQ